MPSLGSRPLFRSFFFDLSIINSSFSPLARQMFLFSCSSSVPVILHLISTSGRFQPRCEADEDEDGEHNSSETRKDRGGRKDRVGSTQGVVQRYRRLGLLFPRVFERPSTKCVFCSSSRLLLGGGRDPGIMIRVLTFGKTTALLSRLLSQRSVTTTAR